MDNFHQYRHSNMRPSASEFDYLYLDEDRPRKRMPLAIKIILWVLLGAIALYSAYAFFVHPVDELRVRLAFAQSCRITITEPTTGGYQNETTEHIIEIDGNVIAITSEGSKQYYVIEDDKTYEYRESSNGEWYKIEVYSGSFSGSSADIDFMLDRSNYKRAAWWKPFTWCAENGNIEVSRVMGKIKYTLYTGLVKRKQTIVFDRIGITKIDRPWAESQK
jgi:hypothetical protein